MFYQKLTCKIQGTTSNKVTPYYVMGDDILQIVLWIWKLRTTPVNDTATGTQGTLLFGNILPGRSHNSLGSERQITRGCLTWQKRSYLPFIIRFTNTQTATMYYSQGVYPVYYINIRILSQIEVIHVAGIEKHLAKACHRFLRTRRHCMDRHP